MIRSSAPDGVPIHVLLIEDNAGDARLILELLRSVTGARVAVERVDRLEPALARLRGAPVDVVLLDLALPDSQDHETFAAVHHLVPDVPIIVLTGMKDENMAARVVHEGAQDYLVKGQVDGPALWRSIRYAVERQHTRLALRSSERKWHAILGAALDAVITVDAAGTIRDWNPRAEVVFGWPAGEVVGKPADAVIPPEHRATYRSALAHFLATGDTTGLGKRVELTALHRDGREFPIEVTVTPIRLDEEWLFCAFLRDITDRRQGEHEIDRLNEVLEARVAERTTALAAANRELEAFTYSVSHDLRAPLRHVSSFVRIFADEFRETLAPKARHYLTRIEDGARRMGHLVDALLMLTRVAKQDLQTRATALTPLVERIVIALKADTTQRRIEWRLGPLPVVACDPRLMEVLLTNLLSNAVKFTRPREHAVIEVGQKTCDGDSVIFVRDNGVGFDMQYADKLFGVFQRQHPSEDFDGTGIGLATVLRIIHKHGWRIWAEAEVDRGATFFFTHNAPAIGSVVSRAQEVA
jgi:PAS domain S-box-containing protein